MGLDTVARFGHVCADGRRTRRELSSRLHELRAQLIANESGDVVLPPLSMLDVSVPCGSCSAPIKFRDRVCPSCRAPVPRDLRSALEARLEATSADFRELKQHVRSTSSVLLILGLLQLALGAGLFFFERSADLVPTEQGAVEALADLIVNGTIGLVMLACYAWSRGSPARAMTTALVFWSLVQLVILISAPRQLLFVYLSPGQILGKLVVLVLLLRGIKSALQARSLGRRLASPAINPA